MLICNHFPSKVNNAAHEYIYRKVDYSFIQFYPDLSLNINHTFLPLEFA